jgi:5'-3' exonuclease
MYEQKAICCKIGVEFSFIDIDINVLRNKYSNNMKICEKQLQYSKEKNLNFILNST